MPPSPPNRNVEVFVVGGGDGALQKKLPVNIEIRGPEVPISINLAKTVAHELATFTTSTVNRFVSRSCSLKCREG